MRTRIRHGGSAFAWWPSVLSNFYISGRNVPTSGRRYKYLLFKAGVRTKFDANRFFIVYGRTFKSFIKPVAEFLIKN